MQEMIETERTPGNIRLPEYVKNGRLDRFLRALVSGEPGIYLLYGKSGVGKSTLLRAVLRGKDVLWLTSETMREMILDEARGIRTIPAEGFTHVVIDNIEDIRGEATVKWFSKVLDRWVDAGIAAAMTECWPRWEQLSTKHPIRRITMGSRKN